MRSWKTQRFQYEKNIGGCFQTSGDTIFRYFSPSSGASVSEQEIDELTDCYEEAFESLVTYTNSGHSDPETYSAESLKLLVDKLNNGVSLKAHRIRGYIVLKSFLIGGDSERVSKREFLILRGLLLKFKDFLKNLLPYRDVIIRTGGFSGKTAGPRKPKDYTHFKKAFSALYAELDKLLSYTDQYRGDRLVSAQELGRFLFGEFYRGQSQTRVNQLLNLIVPFKNLSLNEETATLHRSDMNLFVKQAALAYELLSNFHYFINGEGQNALFPHIIDTLIFIIKFPNQLRHSQIFKGVALQALEDFYLSGIQFLEASIGNKRTGFLTVAKVENFLYALEREGLFKGPRTAEDINLFLADFSAHWMNPGSPITPDLSLDKLKNFWSSIRKWWDRQRLINEMFAQKGLENISMLEHRSPLPMEGEMMASWSHLLKKVGLHQWNQEQRVVFSKDMSRFSYGELTLSNSNWLLVEFFMKPYNLEESDPLSFQN